LVASGSAAEQSPPRSRDLTELSLEELSNTEVTSVSRTREPLADAAAAVAVLTNEDLRRSGATTIPEALRGVPGLHVGKVTSSVWEVSARGFGSTTSDKLLVLSDTRSIYTPLFSGVFWDVQDILLEDIERIEVIRGPGASLWGSNGVNGVINITTKSARDTQGAYFEVGGGSIERGFGAVRYGGQLSNRLYFRIFAKGFDRAGELNPDGPRDDNWKLGHLGLRADWYSSGKDTVTFQADTYEGDVGQIVPAIRITGRPNPTGRLVAGVAGGNALARWTHEFSQDSDFQLRAYYDKTHRDDPTFVDDLDTFDVEVQHCFSLPWRQDVLWGLKFRSTNDRNEGKGLFALQPPNSWDNLFSGFLQDQITILDSLRLTLGTKLSHNDFGGFEYQPNGRLAWSFLSSHTLWGAISRAVRAPNRLERDIAISVTDPMNNPVLRLLGSTSFRSERLLAYEMGYRFQAATKLFLDVAAYYNVYHGLASLEQTPPTVDPQTGQTIFPLVNKNLTDAVAKGIEASVTYSPIRWLRLVANYTNTVLTASPKGQDLNRGYLAAGATSRHQVSFKSFLDLPAHLQLDVFLRYVGAIPAAGLLVPGQDTPAYATMDVRLAWQGWKPLDISLVGQNLFQNHHREFPGGSEVQRAVYAKLAGRF
jgi:iron complex outermembrane receptor protein